MTDGDIEKWRQNNETESSYSEKFNQVLLSYLEHYSQSIENLHKELNPQNLNITEYSRVETYDVRHETGQRILTVCNQVGVTPLVYPLSPFDIQSINPIHRLQVKLGKEIEDKLQNGRFTTNRYVLSLINELVGYLTIISLMESDNYQEFDTNITNIRKKITQALAGRNEKVFGINVPGTKTVDTETVKQLCNEYYDACKEFFRANLAICRKKGDDFIQSVSETLYRYISKG